MKHVFVLAVAVAAFVGSVRAQAPRSVDVQFKAAQHKEEVEGDLKGAIAEYTKISQSQDRTLAAKALLRMAGCYQKLGDAEATRLYERVVREFADQADAAAEARARLAALQAPPSALPRLATQLVWAGQDAFSAIRGAVSPDGRYFSFGLSAGFFVRDLREGTNRRLTKECGGCQSGYSVFSPDGRQVAYAWYYESGKDFKMDLRILPVSAGAAAEPRVVYQNDEMTAIRPFGWTPDSKQLLVLRSLKDGTNQIAMVSVQDGSLRTLKSLTWNYTTMGLSPDGRYIAYDALSGTNTAPTEIFVLVADGSRETHVVHGPAGNGSPLWSPDGSRILFLSDRTGNTSL